MRFFNYFKNQLRWRYIQGTGNLPAVVEGATKSLDAAKETIYWIRKQTTPLMCDDDHLSNHARSRNIETIPGETEEDFKNRVIYAFQWFRRAGRKAGMKQVLSALGWPDATITNCRDYDPEKWAEFDISLNADGKSMSVDSFKSVVTLINSQKPARSKLNTLGLIRSMKRCDYFGGTMFTDNETIMK